MEIGCGRVERVLDAAVRARGTRSAGTQGVLSDGRAASAVFRNTSRPDYCAGAGVSAPPPTAPGRMVHAALLHTTRACRLPRTRWNSKQSKLLLTRRYRVFPSLKTTEGKNEGNLRS